ncbi:MAG: CAP domain-containing protein [Syntrophobacteraceae bacterium]
MFDLSEFQSSGMRLVISKCKYIKGVPHYVLLVGIMLWAVTGCTRVVLDRPIWPSPTAENAVEAPEKRRYRIPPPPVKYSRRVETEAYSSRRSGSYDRLASLPSSPFQRSEENPEDKANRLFELARRENPSLIWNNCLAAKAVQRAKFLVENNSFEHKDPRTGKNPAWDLVASCFKTSCAGENLTRGEGCSSTAMHEALMVSPSHRGNILDGRYNLMGVGCYKHICVELFAGF